VALKGSATKHLNFFLPFFLFLLLLQGASDSRGTARQHCETGSEIRLACRWKIGTGLDAKQSTAVLAYPNSEWKERNFKGKKNPHPENHMARHPSFFSSGGTDFVCAR
jgi:hypothetical protein